MNARLRFWKSGKVTAEHELTQCGVPTGTWLDIGTYNTAKGARIATAAYARRIDAHVRWVASVHSEY